jgi:hypothetical protein
VSEPLSITLTEAEIFEITGYKQRTKQREFFLRLGVPALPKRDGTLSIARAHYDAAVHGTLNRVKIDAPKGVRTIRKIA